jgi:2-polyprenyl-3-methyl-5-hydroxy-6-metoxy-1,4-benzoquinol methylase
MDTPAPPQLWGMAANSIKTSGRAEFEIGARRIKFEIRNFAGERFEVLSREAVTSLLDTVNLRQGERLLDLGIGPGTVAAAAAARGARPIGVDFSEPIVAEARGSAPFLFVHHVAGCPAWRL